MLIELVIPFGPASFPAPQGIARELCWGSRARPESSERVSCLKAQKREQGTARADNPGQGVRLDESAG